MNDEPKRETGPGMSLCIQCSEQIFGDSATPFAGRCEPGQTVKVFCDSCSAIEVDHQGRCLTHESHGV